MSNSMTDPLLNVAEGAIRNDDSVKNLLAEMLAKMGDDSTPQKSSMVQKAREYAKWVEAVAAFFEAAIITQNALTVSNTQEAKGIINLTVFFVCLFAVIPSVGGIKEAFYEKSRAIDPAQSIAGVGPSIGNVVFYMFLLCMIKATAVPEEDKAWYMQVPEAAFLVFFAELINIGMATKMDKHHWTTGSMLAVDASGYFLSIFYFLAIITKQCTGEDLEMSACKTTTLDNISPSLEGMSLPQKGTLALGTVLLLAVTAPQLISWNRACHQAAITSNRPVPHTHNIFWRNGDRRWNTQSTRNLNLFVITLIGGLQKTGALLYPVIIQVMKQKLNVTNLGVLLLIQLAGAFPGASVKVMAHETSLFRLRLTEFLKGNFNKLNDGTIDVDNLKKALSNDEKDMELLWAMYRYSQENNDFLNLTLQEFLVVQALKPLVPNGIPNKNLKREIKKAINEYLSPQDLEQGTAEKKAEAEAAKRRQKIIDTLLSSAPNKPEEHSDNQNIFLQMIVNFLESDKYLTIRFGHYTPPSSVCAGFHHGLTFIYDCLKKTFCANDNEASNGNSALNPLTGPNYT